MTEKTDLENHRSQNQINLTKRVAVTGILIPVGLVLSYINPFAYFTIFYTKINPFAHLINAISGVLIGLSFSIITALGIASLRFSLGIGSIHAFHGGISGAIIVGLVAYILRKKMDNYVEFASFFESIGTVFIGGTIAFIIELGTSWSLLFIYWSLFAASCVPGSILGFLTIKILEKADISWRDFF